MGTGSEPNGPHAIGAAPVPFCHGLVAQGTSVLAHSATGIFRRHFVRDSPARYAAGCISLSSFSRAAFAQPCQRGNFGLTLPV